jgi:hypothetical protein
MTNDELVAVQATLSYRCAGPYVLTDAQREKGQKKRDALMAAGDPAAVVAYIRALDRVLHAVPADFDDDHPTDETLTDAMGRLLGLRAGCGQDLKPLILAGGFDGEVHEGTCPKCGLAFDWRAALSDEEAETKDATRAADLEDALA